MKGTGWFVNRRKNTKMKRIIAALIALILVAALCSCASLPSALKEEKIGKAETFLVLEPSNSNIKDKITKAQALFCYALGSTDDVVTGYSEEDNTIYTISYTDFTKSDLSDLGVDQSKIIPSYEGISKTITESVDFGDCKYGVIVVDGGTYSSSLDVLFIIKDNSVVTNNTYWKSK